MKITKKLLAACVAALALSMPLMGCNGGNTAKPVGSAAGSASKQTTEKRESKKPTDDHIELPPPGIGLLFLLMSRTSRLIGQKVRPIQSLLHGWAAFLAAKTSVETPPERAANKSSEAPMGLRRSSGDIFARSLMPRARSSPCRPCRDAAPREW